MPAGRLVGGMRDTGHIETAFAYLAAGRGVVFALPHMGNWDQAGAWIIASGAGSLTAVIERVKPESVYGRFVAFREGLAMEVLPASGGTQRFAILAQRLRAGKTVGLICDRDVTGGGIEVEFFGEKARMMGGPAALAVQTGAALMPVILWFEGDGWGVHVHEEIPVPAEGDREQQAAAMMQQVACLFEAGIRAHPQDWHMLQKVFAADLDPGAAAACGCELASIEARRQEGSGRSYGDEAGQVRRLAPLIGRALRASVCKLDAYASGRSRSSWSTARTGSGTAPCSPAACSMTCGPVASQSRAPHGGPPG